MLNICSSVQDHNQSTIHRDSDWTSHRAKEFIWSLKASRRMRLKKASGRMRLENCVWRKHLKNCVWRNESEEELLKTRHQKQGHQKHISSEARSSETMTIRSISHQKQGHQKLWRSEAYLIRSSLHQSWQRTMYELYGHELCNHHLCLHIKTKITVTWLQTLFLWKRNGFEISSS